MNLFALNGGSLNGVPRLVVAAVATFACTAALSASATRAQDALAPLSSGAQFVATATHTRNASTTFDATASVYVSASHNKAASVLISGTAGLQAFVLRQQTAEAQFSASANLVVIPASTLGSSNLAGTAALVANATKIQPGVSSLESAASVTITTTPVVTRMVQANALSGAASIRVEPQFNGVTWSYSDVVATASFAAADSGLAIRNAQAYIECVSSLSIVATHIKPGGSALSADGTFINADAFIQKPVDVAFVASANVTAEGGIARMGEASATGAASIALSPVVIHGSSASVVATGANVVATAIATRNATALSAQSGCELVAAGARVLVPSASAVCEATLDASAVVSVTASIQTLAGAATLDADALVTRMVVANAVTGTAQITASCVHWQSAIAACAGSSAMTATANRLANCFADVSATSNLGAVAVRVLAPVASIECSATILADTTTNADSYDPPERTFVRVASQVVFLRPENFTEFKRAA